MDFKTSDFKTKTIFENRNQETEKWPIAADIGYSGVKVMSPGLYMSFPSYAVKLTEDRGTIGEVDEDYILYKDVQTGEKWLVGQYAQNDISDRDTSVTEEALFGRERYEDPMFKVIVKTAIGFGMMRGGSKGPSGKEIIIQTGFPPAYELDKEELTNVFCGEHWFTLQVGNKKPEEFHVEIEKSQIFLMAQPMGTLFSVSVDNTGKPVKEFQGLFKKNVIVFDAGFGTLDVFPIRNGRLEKSQTNQTLGMKRVMQETCQKLQKSGINISVPALQKYLESGYAKFHTRIVSKNVAFGDILKECSEQICDEAINWLTQMFPLYEYDYLIITGGTSAAWANRIRETLKDMETLKIINGNCNDNIPLIFANVRGYYLYRMTKLSQRR